MKTKLHLVPILAIVAVAVVSGQGPLTPPGVPAPAMKTLDQVEPRTPISSLPFTINQGGSYYLTRNLLFAAIGANAITITASNVTLDLNGFTLSSNATADGEAIHVEPNLHGIVVRNGAITGTSTVSITGTHPNRTWAVIPGGFATGIQGRDNDLSIRECRFENLTIRGCRMDGLATGPGAVVDGVTSAHNGGNGIFANENCSITNCTAAYNIGHGIYVAFGTVSACAADHNGQHGITCGGGSVCGCAARWSGGSGIQASRTSIAHCCVNDCDGDGIRGVSCNISHSMTYRNGSDGIANNSGVVAFCLAEISNLKNNGSVNIDAGPLVTRTGNNPTP